MSRDIVQQGLSYFVNEMIKSVYNIRIGSFTKYSVETVPTFKRVDLVLNDIENVENPQKQTLEDVPLIFLGSNSNASVS